MRRYNSLKSSLIVPSVNGAACTGIILKNTIQSNTLALSGNLWAYLADLNEQAQQRMETLVAQLKSTEGITEVLKATDPMSWTQHMNNITARAEEIIREELIYNG